jgi:hypothetical protein
MKKIAAILIGLGVAAVFGFFGWAFYAAAGVSDAPWLGGGATRILIVAGVVVTGLLTGVLMWLAFYSSKKGYDEPVHFDGHDEPR